MRTRPVAAPDLPAADRARAVRRNTILLAAAEPSLRATLTLSFTVAAVAVFQFSGDARWNGAFTATYSLFEAGGAFSAGRVMDRWGRRRGLVPGYLSLMAGSAVAALGVAARSPGLLLVAAGLLGSGSGAGRLGRAAVADMYPPAKRGRAIGIVLAVGTIGAVGGPLLAGAVQSAAQDRHGDPLLVPWMLSAVLAAVGLACVLALRPDPRELAVQDEGGETAVRPLRTLIRLPQVRAGVVAIAVAQLSMVAVMGVTPVVIHQHGGGNTAVAVTISAHVAGMFAFSPLIGWALDRWGRQPGLVFGAVLAAAGALGAGFAEGRVALGTGVFVVGLGWSAAFLASTALITDATNARERGSALGFADLVAALSAAVGGGLGGFVVQGLGFGTLGVIVAVVLLPVLLVVLRLREPLRVPPAP